MVAADIYGKSPFCAVKMSDFYDKELKINFKNNFK